MSQAVVGALRVDLGLDASAFRRGLADAQSSLRSVGRSMAQIGTRMSAAITAPMAGMTGVILRTAGDFEASMKRVRGNLRSGDEEFAALQQAARDMGAATQFSASEAADAIETLAKNGLTASAILGGALQSSLTLAAAGSTDLANAGDIVTDVMENFRKGAGELTNVVDGIAGTLVESKFGIDDYRQALAQAGGVAGPLGVEFEDFNAAIAATASAFASGSDAGTSLKTFLQSLSPNSKRAADTIKQFKLEFFDAEGAVKSMAEVAQELKTAFADVSAEAQSDALKKIFGTDAIRTALGLMREGADGIKQVSDEIANASAQEQAEIQLEGLNGTIKELRSAFEELQLAIADSGLLESFTTLLEKTTELVRFVGELDPKIVSMGTAFAGLTAALGPAMLIIGGIVAVIGAPAIGAIAVIAAVAAGVITFRDEIAALAGKLREVETRINEFVSNALTTLRDMAGDIVTIFAELPAKMVEIGGNILSGLKQGILSKYEDVKASVVGVFKGLIGVSEDVNKIKSPSRVYRQIGSYMMEGLGQGIEDTGAQVQASVSGVFSGVGNQVKGLVKGILTQTTSLRQGVSNILGNIGARLFDSGFDMLWSGLGLPAFAHGTSFAPGGMALVGERGPELVNLPRGSQVVPNHDLSKLGGGGSIELIVRQEPGIITEMVRNEVGAGVRAYDQALPERVSQINRDPLRRG